MRLEQCPKVQAASGARLHGDALRSYRHSHDPINELRDTAWPRRGPGQVLREWRALYRK